MTDNNEEDSGFEATPTEIYLGLDDAELQVKNAIDKLKKELQSLQYQKEVAKQRILTDYRDLGLLPDDGLIIKELKPKPVVTDETKLDDFFFKTKKELQKAELNKYIKEHGLIDGVEMDEGGLTLAIVAKKQYR